MAKKPTPRKPKTASHKAVETLRHGEASRTYIPTAEYQSVMQTEEMSPIRIAYERRNRDLDPQLVWRGKDEQDTADLVVAAPPLYIQEKIHPKALIDDLRRHSEAGKAATEEQPDLFADFNGLPSEAAKTEFYQHDANWSNRMILGDSLQVMASLAEREGLRGKVQCIYLDPPYGIKFNSNFQWSTTSRDVNDGNAAHITREPEQVKAFRDTWRDGIHSYLTYLRDRLTVARNLLADSGSIFVQIGDENVHRVRAVMDEVFGADNFVSAIQFQKTGSQASRLLANTVDFVLWFTREGGRTKYRQLFSERTPGHVSSDRYDQIELAVGLERRLTRHEVDGAELLAGRTFRHTSLISSGQSGEDQSFEFRGRRFRPGSGAHWKTKPAGLARLSLAGRVAAGSTTVRYKRYKDDFAVLPITDRWESVQIGTSLVYVVQTSPSVAARCILMATDPGDLVLDPTCGSGTTAYVAEQWGRRWITIDTSRVALALARARIMGARYPYYLLADSRAGQMKEAEITGKPPSSAAVSPDGHGDVRLGFVYERVPHVTLKSIASNTEIDIIWEDFQTRLEPLREELNAALRQIWEEWQIPREADTAWPAVAKKLHAEWWQQRIERQKKIDASIAAKADTEYLYDRPYADNKKVRVAGPFTVESVSPHRILTVGEDDELIEPLGADDGHTRRADNFTAIMLENLRVAGVQQAHKDDKIAFTALAPWPGNFVCAEGRYTSDGAEKRAGIFIGPEFGTVSRPDLVAAAREAGDAGFDVLIACAFNYDAHSSEFMKLGRIPILKARMNADLHMAGDLKNTGKGNLFVIFGEPEIEVLPADGSQLQVKLKGVDVFDPSSGEVRSDSASGIACWFIDTDYNEESFFVRHAYFLGANDPYKALKTTLKAEINEDAWETLHSDTSRPFAKPASGRIAVKVINHLGDEVMKIFRVS